MTAEADVSEVLPAIRVPTLILHRPSMVGPAEYVTQRIPQAEVVELPGLRDAYTWADDAAHELTIDETERFVSKLVVARGPDRVLATILFTDIVGSTELNVRAGDEQYVPLLNEHDRILRARLRQHGGVEYTHTGDGMSAWFTSASSAITCTFGMQADLERAAITHPELPVRVRMGISAGRPVDTGEGLFGLAVVTSARICALAGSGQVFVSDEVRRSAQSVCAFGIIGERELKGIPGTSLIYEALDLANR